MELHELQELRDTNNKNLCFMISNEDENIVIHDDLINKMCEVQSTLDELITERIRLEAKWKAQDERDAMDEDGGVQLYKC